MPYSEDAKYRHHRRINPSKFQKGTFRTVPLSHTDYSGTKFNKNKDKAIVGKMKSQHRDKGDKWRIQSILEKK